MSIHHTRVVSWQPLVQYRDEMHTFLITYSFQHSYITYYIYGNLTDSSQVIGYLRFLVLKTLGCRLLRNLKSINDSKLDEMNNGIILL